MEYLRIIYLLKFQPLNLSKYLTVPYLSLVFLSVIPFLYLDIVFGSINWLKLSAEGSIWLKPRSWSLTLILQPLLWCNWEMSVAYSSLYIRNKISIEKDWFSIQLNVILVSQPKITIFCAEYYTKWWVEYTNDPNGAQKRGFLQ